MQGIPVECVVKIFAYLDAPALRAVRYVSKWAAAAADVVAEDASYDWLYFSKSGTLFYKKEWVAFITVYPKHIYIAYDYYILATYTDKMLECLQKYDRGTIRAMLRREFAQ